jgi:hypothetical protein
MQTHLTRTVRDNAGHVHPRGEHVTILGHWLELGTHRDLLRARWDSGDTAILLPEDVEEDWPSWRAHHDLSARLIDD